MTIGIHPTADKIEDFLSENCNHKGLRIVNLSNSVVQPPGAIVVKNYGMKNSQPVSVEIIELKCSESGDSWKCKGKILTAQLYYKQDLNLSTNCPNS